MAAVAPDCTNWSLAVLRHASSILPAALARWWPKLPEATHAVTACQSLVSNHHLSFECRSAETHPQPVRSPTSYGAPPVFLFVSHGEVAWMDSTATDLAPRARKSLNSFEVQPSHRAGTSCWQGAGRAEPHFMPCASAEGVAGESTSSLRDEQHFPGMVPRF